MADAKTCPTCGAPLAADAPGGVCPKCLLVAGFATGASGAAASAPLPTPEELAPHFPTLVIDRLLGRGGMGVVYKARHKALDRDVALKVLPATVAADPSFAERFQREARALARLQHPNIVTVHDFGQSVDEKGGGLFWLVMEFVDGANIRQAMKAGQVGAKEALAIVPQICDALQYAHEHGVVHRDIKPENVLLDKSGRVKVADFGLAKMMERGESDRTLTGAGQVMGTPHYMAPEQWERPNDVDHRADIYSLGVVFYEMLTGELPVGRFAPPSVKSHLDARIDEIVLRTLEREREARYQRADEVKTDVGRMTEGPAPPPPPPPPATTPQAEGAAGNARVHGRWRWDSAEEKARGGRVSRLAVAGALAGPVVVVLLVVGYVLSESPASDEPSSSGWFAFTALPLAAIGLYLAGWIASVIAWVRIQNSGDRLRGRAWAAAGTFLPLFLCCIGAPLSLILSKKHAPQPPAPAPHQSGLLPPSMPADAGLRILLARLIDVGDDRSWARVESLYSRWGNPIRLLPEGDRNVAEKGAKGHYGLPLVGVGVLPAPLQLLRVRTVEESADRRRARVVLEHQDRTVEFGLVSENGEWLFAPEPILVR